MLAGELSVEGQEGLFSIRFSEGCGVAVDEGEGGVGDVEVEDIEEKGGFEMNVVRIKKTFEEKNNPFSR